MFFNPNEVHQTKSITNEPLGYYCLHISLQWCKNNKSKLFGTDEVFINISENIVEEKAIYDDLLRIFNMIIVNEKDSSNEELEDKITNILEKHIVLNKNKDFKKNENKLLLEAEKFILETIDEQITLKDLALKIGYNESYITRLFKKKFGLTPHAFIVNKKVNKAKNELVEAENISLAQLSNEAGFYDQSHLYKVFKRSYAVSPKKYIKK